MLMLQLSPKGPQDKSTAKKKMSDKKLEKKEGGWK